MKRSFLIFCVFILPLSFSSCKLNDDGVNFHYAPLKIIRADLPESFNLYEIYDINVTLLRPDDCTLIEGFDVVKGDSTVRNVVAIGAILEKEDCKVIDQEIEDSFQFEVRYTTTYLFRFFTGEDENGEAQYLEMEVPVNQTSANK